jgi:biotin carboxylase
MKTVVVISTRGFGAFRHDLLAEPEDVRLIGIFSQADVVNVTPAQREYFHQVHTVGCGVAGPTYAESSLVDLQAARVIVKDLLAQAGTGDVAVLSYDEQNVLAAAALRTEFGLPGASYDDVLPYRNKCLMKEKLAGTGLRVPTWGRFDPAAFAAGPGRYFDKITGEVGFPFVLKPVDAAASDGVYKIFSREEFTGLPPRLRRDYEYEEYIEGTMYSVNLMSAGRRTVVGGVTEYLVNSTEVQQGQVNADINLIGSDPRVPTMIGFAETALTALGWLDGATHLELFRTGSGELVFLEVGARLKGLAGVAAMQRNYAVALVNLALEIEAGVKSHPWDAEQVYCFDAVVPKRPGIVAELREPVLDSEFEFSWKVRVGEEISKGASLSDNGGTFLVWNKNYDVLYADFKRLAGYSPIRYQD